MGIGRRIRAEGPIPCAYMVIREHPGKDEAKTGRPFSGKTGREMSRFLDGITLPSLHQMYLTAYIKEWCGEDGDYTNLDYDRDRPALITEVQAVRPSYILTLGREVTRLFLGDVDMEEVHGIPWYVPPDSPARAWLVDPASVVVVPVYNPAAGFRSPELSAAVAYDFAQLVGVLDGKLTPRILYDDPIPNPVYTVIEDLDTLDAVMSSACDISTDSEGYPWEPWSVQLTTEAGTSWIVRCTREPGYGALIQRFAEWVNADPKLYTWTFHNALHDLAVFRAIGIDTTRLVFDDTMIMAYNLQLEPQGLKPLCARWCNMKMLHFDEVMGDATNRLAVDWLLSSMQVEEMEHEQRCQDEFVRLTTTPYTDAKGKVQPGRKLKVAPKLPKSPLQKAIERCLKSQRPRGLWDDQIIDLHVEAAHKYGPIWHATLDHVDPQVAIHYAGRDSDGTHRLKPGLVERLHANELWDVYQADLGTVPLIDRMQQIGIKPDLDHFARLSEDLTAEIGRIRITLADQLLAAGVDTEKAWDFNPNGGDQTAQLLFETFQLPVLKRTPGGDASTNDKVLEALERDQKLDKGLRDIISTIRLYRETYKLKSTFVDAIPDYVNRWPYDGRIHPTFRITRVVTGRLAASDPNILAMPKHGKFAKRFRDGFVSGDGRVLASWDLSQIELRVLAHLSQDPVLLNAFRTGQDLHATLAQRIFGVEPAKQDKSLHRLPAKAVNFGIPMGMTAIGLCLELRKNGVDIDEDDAQRWLDETMALYSQVPVYQMGKVAEARRYGFVTDLRGRRRYIGGIRSYDDAIRSEAERFAFSTPIQAGAQEVMKEAEGYIYREVLLPWWETGRNVEPIVQIHDDLVMETDAGNILDLNDVMVHAMTKVPQHWLSVPIETSGDFGVTWGDMCAIRCAKCGRFNEEREHKACKGCGGKLD